MPYNIDLAKEICKEMGIEWDNSSKNITVGGKGLSEINLMELLSGYSKEEATNVIEDKGMSLPKIRNHDIYNNYLYNVSSEKNIIAA